MANILNHVSSRILLSALVMCLTLTALAAGQAKHPKHSAKPTHRISAAQASRAALAKYKGKVVGKVDLEDEEGQWQYSVNVRSGRVLREVMVDAKTGKIASVEVTTPKDEAKEAAAEKKHKGGH